MLWLVVGGMLGWTWGRRAIDARASRPERRPRVSRRQAQILALVARGMSTKEIARHERISEHSVNTHIRRARRSLGVQSRAAAVAALEPAQTPARPRRSATRVRATTTSPTSSSNGT
jgi:DNA-binding CsgD family transcriptional regulator